MYYGVLFKKKNRLNREKQWTLERLVKKSTIYEVSSIEEVESNEDAEG